MEWAAMAHVVVRWILERSLRGRRSWWVVCSREGVVVATLSSLTVTFDVQVKGRYIQDFPIVYVGRMKSVVLSSLLQGPNHTRCPMELL